MKTRIMLAATMAVAIVACIVCAGCAQGQGSTASSSSASSAATSKASVGNTASASTSASGSSQNVSAGGTSASASAQPTSQVGEKAAQLVLKVGDKEVSAQFADTVSATALKDFLAGGSIALSLHDYGNFEKVGPLTLAFAKDDERITTEPGDIVLYQGNQISIFYGSNTWEYTRLAKIDGATRESMLALLGEGDVEVTLSLA